MLRAQPIPLLFIKLLVDPNWHRGASLVALASAWITISLFDQRCATAFGCTWITISLFDQRCATAFGRAWITISLFDQRACPYKTSNIDCKNKYLFHFLLSDV
jgi:hypothetical protein